MAVIQQQFDEEEQQGEDNSQQLSTGPQGQQGANTGGQGSAVGNPGARYQTPEKKGSGRFMNLQKYLGANTGAGERLAGSIQSMAGRQADKVQQNSSQADQISQNIQKEKDRLSQTENFNKQIQEGQAQKVAQNNLQDFTNLRTGQNDLQNIQQQGQQYQNVAQSGIQGLQGLSDQSKSESGRFNLLRQAYGGGRPGSTYGLGQRRLDQLFLQAEGGGQLNQLQNQLGGQVSQAQDTYNQFKQNYGQGVQDIQDQTASAQQSIEQTLGGFDDTGAGAFGDIYSQLAQQQADYGTKMSDNLSRAQSQLRTGTISQDIADQLGLESGMQIGDLDLGTYADRLQAGDKDITMADVINDPQSQQLSALQQLAGIDPSSQFLGEKEGSLLTGLTGTDLEKAAQERMLGFDDRFFDKKLSDIDAFRNAYTGKDLENYIKRAGDTTLLDEIRMLTGQDVKPNTASNFYADLADDVTSREQIQNVINEYDNVLKNKALQFYRPGRESYGRLLDQYDKSFGRRLNITPESDIESGGQFNVT